MSKDRLVLLAREGALTGMLVGLLEGGGFEVRLAESANEAFAELSARVALLLVALDVPKLDAGELLRHVAVRKPLLPVVALSPRGNDEGVIKALRAGAAGCVLFDDANEQLLPAIRDALLGEAPLSRGLHKLLVAHVRRHPQKSTGTRAVVRPITPRERAVLEQLARGLNYEEIGTVIGVSLNTVRSFVRTIYEKLEVNSRTEAVLVGIKLGLVKRTPYPGTKLRD